MTSCTVTSTGCGSPRRQRTMCSGSGLVAGRTAAAKCRNDVHRIREERGSRRRRSARRSAGALDSTATVNAPRNTPRSRRAWRGSITSLRAPPRITTATPVAPAPSVSSRNGEPSTAPVATRLAPCGVSRQRDDRHDRLRQRCSECGEEAAGRAGAEVQEVAGPLDRVGEELRCDDDEDQARHEEQCGGHRRPQHPVDRRVHPRGREAEHVTDRHRLHAVHRGGAAGNVDRIAHPLANPGKHRSWQPSGGAIRSAHASRLRRGAPPMTSPRNTTSPAERSPRQEYTPTMPAIRTL